MALQAIQNTFMEGSQSEADDQKAWDELVAFRLVDENDKPDDLSEGNRAIHGRNAKCAEWVTSSVEQMRIRFVTSLDLEK